MSNTKLHGIFFKPPIENYYLGHQMSEVYRENIYSPLLRDRTGLTIIDIGSNIGITTYHFSKHAKVVHSVEPSIEHFETLKFMVEFNELKNVELHKQAIWIKNQKGTLYKNINKTMYSLHGIINDNSGTAETVDVVTLDKFFKDNKIEQCDFMKLDVEGSEYEVLASEGFRLTAPKIDMIMLEYHNWAGRNPGQLRQSLENNGFKVLVPKSEATLLVGVKDEKGIVHI